MGRPIDRFAALAAVCLAAGCVQPLKLARDDSATVLAHQLIDAPDPRAPGPLAVKHLYYGSGNDRHRAEFRDSLTLETRTVDGSKLARAPTPAIGKSRRKYWGFGFDKLPVNGRVWYPDGPGPYPLVLVVHGNHDMTDFSDPGYEYLGRHLASRGYILASVDENFLNGNLRGENDARGWMLLKHLEAWRGFNDSSNSPFHHKVDLGKIALMGHSRGGEAVAVAGAFNRLRHYPDDATVEFDHGFAIKGLVAIAPIDGQYEPAEVPTPLENVNYLVIHGSHDGDVSAFSGLRQYQRIEFTDGGEWFKSAIWMYRANHGQWNTVWGNQDNGPRSARYLDLRGLIGPEEQRRFALVVITGFLEAALRGNKAYLPLFADHRVAGGWLPKTRYVTRFQESGYRALASYDEDVDVTTGSRPGVTLEGDSLATWREGQVPLRWRNTEAGHGAVWLGWNNRIAGDDTTKRGRPAAYRIGIPDSLRAAWAVGQQSAVVLSLTPTTAVPAPRKPKADSAAKDSTTKQAEKKPPAPKAKPEDLDSMPVDLSIEARDAGGTVARISLGRYGAIRRVPEVTVQRRKGQDKSGFASLRELVLQTYVIPLADFARAAPGFRPERLASIALVFDRTEAGTVVVTDIGLSRPDPAFFAPKP
ncbi:MAG: alpha/beta hydrolase family protein [Gemmatimonadales bacterium]